MNRGGSYIKDKNGKLKKREGTENHPEGNRPRAADGQPLNVNTGTPQPVAESATTEDTAAAKRGDK